MPSDGKRSVVSDTQHLRSREKAGKAAACADQSLSKEYPVLCRAALVPDIEARRAGAVECSMSIILMEIATAGKKIASVPAINIECFLR